MDLTTLLDTPLWNNITLRSFLSAALLLAICLVAVRLLMKLARRLISNTKLDPRV